MDSSPHLANDLSERIAGFVRELRDNGFSVGVAEQLSACQAVASLGISRRAVVRQGLKSILCSNYREWNRFDLLFEAYWHAPQAHYYGVRYTGAMGEVKPKRSRINDTFTSLAVTGNSSGDFGTSGASPSTALQGRDFEFIESPAEMEQLQDLAEIMARNMGRRIAHRRKVANRGNRVDLRRTIRANLAYGGMLLQPTFSQRKIRQPRLMLIVDVSRSMSVYGYTFLRFVRGLLGAFKQADAFACHTQLVNLTYALRRQDLSTVRRSLQLLSAGWSGGTRLAECLARLNRDYTQLMSSRTIAVVISDGLDTCKPDLMAKQTRLLRSRNRKLVWLNPLLGKAGYKPRAAAMRAALPNIDMFAPAHNLDSLTAIAPALTRL